MELKNWEFPHLIYQYLENYYYFKWQYHFGDQIFRYKYELKKLQAVLNAFTGKTFDIESDEGRDEIQELFEWGFELEDELCNDVELASLCSLFPQQRELFDKFKDYRPRKRDFYILLFDSLFYGFEYITTFYDVKYPPEANIVHTFKEREIDEHIDYNDDILIKAIMVLLGDELCGKTFTTKELKEKYGYPQIM